MIADEMKEYLKKLKIKVKKEDYHFGVILHRGGSRYDSSKFTQRYIAICNCGQHALLGNLYSDVRCENCKNEYFVDCTNKSHYRFTIPYLGLYHKDSRGFKIKRTNLSIVLTGEGVLPIQENLIRTMEFEMVDKVLKIWRGDELEFDATGKEAPNHNIERVNQSIMAGLDDKMFWNFIGTDVTRDIFEIAKSIAGQSRWTKLDNNLRGLSRMLAPDMEWVQILANAGVTKVKRFYENPSNYRYSQGVIDETKKKPHEILKVPKFMMDFIRQDLTFDRSILKSMQSHLVKLNVGQFREIVSIVKDEGTLADLSNSIEDIMNIHIDYGYDNIRKLILYLFREVKLTQGIETASESSTLLKDYIRMSRALELDWEKYPKSLKKVHDVVTLNYRLINNNERVLKNFQFSVEKNSYKQLAYEEKKEPFIIVTPTSPQDLVKEGNQLSHCVSSYTKAVIEDKCKIVFLRDKEEPEQPLVTIEVRGFNIRQAKGRSNRPVTPEQKEFIKKWAKEKELIEAYY